MWKTSYEKTAQSTALNYSDLINQNKELKEKLAQLERDYEELLSINIDLQEALEAEKARSLDLAQQLLAERKAHLSSLSEEESIINDQRAILDLLQTQIQCVANLASDACPHDTTLSTHDK